MSDGHRTRLHVRSVEVQPMNGDEQTVLIIGVLR